MPFQFPLETLLRYRRNTEQSEWLKLQGLAQQLATARSQLQAIQRIQEEFRLRYAEHLRNGLRGAEIQFIGDCESAFRLRLDEAQQRLAAAEEDHKRQIEVFREERRKREVLEQLRVDEYERFRQERRRREQNQVDELFLIRRGVPRG